MYTYVWLFVVGRKAEGWVPNVVYRGEHISHISHTHLHQSTPSIQCRIFGTIAALSVFICLYTWQDGVLNVVYREEHLSHVGDPAIYTSVSHTHLHKSTPYIPWKNIHKANLFGKFFKNKISTALLVIYFTILN